MAEKTEKKDVAVRESTEMNAIPEDMLREMEEAAAEAKKEINLQEDVRLPSLQLVQATTALEGIDARPGEIVDTLTGEAYKEVEILPLTMYKTRVLFGSELGEPPICSSPDAVNGYGEVGDALQFRGSKGGGDCSRCPEARWQSGGKCKLRYCYLGVVLGAPQGTPLDFKNELPRGIVMQGTSAKIASKLNTLLLSAKFPWSNAVRLSSTTEKNERGNYRVWSVVRARPASTEEMIHSFQLSKQIAASRTVHIEGDEATAPVGATGKDEDIPF